MPDAFSTGSGHLRRVHGMCVTQTLAHGEVDDNCKLCRTSSVSLSLEGVRRAHLRRWMYCGTTRKDVGGRGARSPHRHHVEVTVDALAHSARRSECCGILPSHDATRIGGVVQCEWMILPGGEWISKICLRTLNTVLGRLERVGLYEAAYKCMLYDIPASSGVEGALWRCGQT